MLIDSTKLLILRPRTFHGTVTLLATVLTTTRLGTVAITVLHEKNILILIVGIGYDIGHHIIIVNGPEHLFMNYVGCYLRKATYYKQSIGIINNIFRIYSC